VPVIGIGLGFLLLAYAVLRKNLDLQKVSLFLLVITGLVAVAVYLTGEPAEETVEHLAGVSEAIIEKHEEAALVALIGATVLGAVSLGGLLAFRRSKAVAKTLVTVALFGSLIASGLMAWTANLGGQIRHSEIRAAAATLNEDTKKDQKAVAPDSKKQEHDEDD
jgi:hypothetical protein